MVMIVTILRNVVYVFSIGQNTDVKRVGKKIWKTGK